MYMLQFCKIWSGPLINGDGRQTVEMPLVCRFGHFVRLIAQ